MSKTILASVDGWTPVIDAVVLDVGLVSAAVFGKAWRYCQMSDGVCKASQDRIADELGMSRATINTHLAKLTEAGYLKDLTPDLLGLPHQYADTGKANLSISLTATCQKDLHPPVKNIDTKKEVKETKELNVNERAALLQKLYKENIGAMVPIMIDFLRNAAIDYPDSSWYAPAFEIAVKGNGRNWNFVSKVLQNWKEKGRGWSPVAQTYRGNGKKKPAQSSAPEVEYDYDVLRKIAREAQNAINAQQKEKAA